MKHSRKHTTDEKEASQNAILYNTKKKIARDFRFIDDLCYNASSSEYSLYHKCSQAQTMNSLT